MLSKPDVIEMCVFFVVAIVFVGIYMRKLNNVVKTGYEPEDPGVVPVVPEVSPTGMVQVTFEHIDTCDSRIWTPLLADSVFLPEPFLRHVLCKTNTSVARQARGLLSMGCFPNYTYTDMCRGFTISSAIYGYPIPKQLLLLDADTKAYYFKIMRMMRPQLFSVDNLDFQELLSQDSAPEETTALIYVSMLNKIGAVILEYAAQAMFPPKYQLIADIEECFPAGNRTRLSMDIMVRENQILSLATAFGMITGIRLPKDYYLKTAITAATVQAAMKIVVAKPKPKLSLVTS